MTQAKPAPRLSNGGQTQRSHTTVIALSYAAFIVLGLVDSILGVAWPSMSRDFKVSLDALGVLLIANTLGFQMASFTMGRLLTRFDMATFLMMAGVVRVISMISLATAPSWWLMAVAAFLYGVGSGAIDAGLNTYFAMRFDARRMNWLHACFGVGATFGPLFVTALLQADASWRWSYATLALLQIGIVAAVYATRSSWLIAPQQHKAGPSGASAGEIVRRTLMMPAVWLGITVFFFYTGLEVTAGQWSYTLFTEGRGISVETAGRWLSIYWGTFTLGRFVFGFISEGQPIVRLIRYCLLGSLAGAALLWWNPNDLVSFVGLAVIGFTLAPIFPLLVTETPERIGAERAQHAIGFQVGAANLGIAVLPSLVGVIAVRASLEFIPIAIVIGALILALVHEVMVWQHGGTVKSEE